MSDEIIDVFAGVDLPSVYQAALKANESLYYNTIEHKQKNKLKRDEQEPGEIALEALMWAIKYKLAIPQWAATACLEAFEKYQNFEVATISDAFGTKKHTHLKAKRDERLGLLIVHEVQKLLDEGTSLTGNNKAEGALAIVGNQLDFSAKKVELIRTRWLPVYEKSEAQASDRAKETARLINTAFADALRPKGKRSFSTR